MCVTARARAWTSVIVAERESITHTPQPPLVHVPARATLYGVGGEVVVGGGGGADN